MEINVISILEESKALLTGHFLLSSGKHSSQYFQCARLLQYPDKAASVITLIVKKLQDEKKCGALTYDCVIGPAMGGIVVAYELGRQLKIPAFFTERNDEGIMSLRRGFEIEKGMRVIIAEDVITTGKSTLEAAACIESFGGIVTAAVCIVDRRPAQESSSPFPLPLYSALKQSAVLWEAGHCPLCKEGGTPVKPGSRKDKGV